MKSKLKIGPQTALDYKRSIIPQFEQFRSANNVRVKQNEYFSSHTKNLWDDYGKLIEKNKKFLSKERNEKIEKHAKDLELADRKDKEIIKQSKILKNKEDSKQRIEKKLLEIALLQQQSCQDVDERQIQILMNHPQSPFEINKSKLKSTGRQFLNGAAENKWNNLTELSTKNQNVVFTPKVITFEKVGIQNIQKKIEDIDENKELVKSCFIKEGDELRKSFQQKHKKNLELEKDLKIGVFGKNGLDKTKTKIIRIAHTPTAYNKLFPNKFETDPYIQKLKDKPIPEKQMQLYNRLSTPKKSFEPENVFEYADFKGMLVPAIDKIMCVKQENIVKQFQNSPLVKNLANSVNDPNSLIQIIKRPGTACSNRKGFQMEPLSSFDDIQIQRSQNFNYPPDSTKNQLQQELDHFSDKLKKSALSRPLSGFCKVTQKENELLKNTDGLRKIRELKKEQNYPYNVIKGLDISL